MKTLILLVGISLTLASPSGSKRENPRQDEFVIPEKTFPDTAYAGNPRPKNENIIPIMKFPGNGQIFEKPLIKNIETGNEVENLFVMPEEESREMNLDDKREQEIEFEMPQKQYPEVITNFVTSDYSNLPIEELIQIASEHEGLGFLSDANATAAMGFDASTFSHDIIADAMATTVR